LTTRVRFAPSPTGLFHVGSARSALFNWLFARQQGGVFLLRIEDTDADRNREEWVDVIINSMQWLGMDIDEGPFRQSANAAQHSAAVEALYAAGVLYPCACTGEEVQARKGDNKTPGYDGHCRELNVARSATTALRFKVPEGMTIVNDVIRGTIEFQNAVIDDFVVAKSSGAVLYNMANVVDDRADRITHVIRGEDHISNTPKQQLIWEALSRTTGPELPLPVYAHLPLLVDASRKKLSKRKDPVSVELFRDQGFLADAFVNFLSLLGWSPRGDEKVSRSELIAQFALEDVNQSPAFFDVAKLTNLNGAYVRELSLEDFIAATLPWVDPRNAPWSPEGFETPWPAERFNLERYRAIAPVVQERVALLSEVPAMVDFLFLENPPVDEAAWAKAVTGDSEAGAILDAAIAAYGEATFEAQVLHEVTLAFTEELGLKLRKVQAPIRVALTGKSVGPPLFESLVVVGRDEVLRRLHAARQVAGSTAT
jgi:glutamyl-tRNA synthetase